MTKATTFATSFYPCNAGNTPLFAVPAGVPVADAMGQLCCLLDIAQELAALQCEVPSSKDQLGHACHVLVQLAGGLAESCYESLRAEVNHA